MCVCALLQPTLPFQLRRFAAYFESMQIAARGVWNVCPRGTRLVYRKLTNTVTGKYGKRGKRETLERIADKTYSYWRCTFQSTSTAGSGWHINIKLGAKGTPKVVRSDQLRVDLAPTEGELAKEQPAQRAYRVGVAAGATAIPTLSAKRTAAAAKRKRKQARRIKKKVRCSRRRRLFAECNRHRTSSHSPYLLELSFSQLVPTTCT